MQLKKYITGLQHVGLPVQDMEQTLEFYRNLGFEEAFSTLNQGSRVVFMQQKGLVIEMYEQKKTAGIPGAVEHLALGVKDIEKTFELAKAQGWKVLDNAIQFLPFWEHGVKFFTIVGPNGEKIEFSQMLS
ncbi:MAG: VOC family protein [Oscillospiraceae bacterium]